MNGDDIVKRSQPQFNRSHAHVAETKNQNKQAQEKKNRAYSSSFKATKRLPCSEVVTHVQLVYFLFREYNILCREHAE